MKNLLIIITVFSFYCESNAELFWDQLNPDCREIYDILIDKNDKIYIAGDGLYSGFFISKENGYDWQYKNNGLGKIALSSLSLNDTVLYAGSFGQGVFRSTNYGEKWEPINNGLKSDTTDGSIWSLVSSGPNIYAGTPGRGILISTNNGESWQPKNEGLPIVGIISGLCILDSTLFIGVSDGETSYCIYKSSNNGDSWESTNKGIQNPPQTFIRQFKTFKGTIYVATGKGVFVSTDKGSNWEEKNNGIYGFPVMSLAINDKYLFAGTLNSQIFMSTDNGDSWKLIFDGITNGRIQTLALSKDYLFAGTTYVKSSKWGIFRTRLSDIETSVEDTPEKSDQLIYPNPASDYIEISISAFNPTVNRRVEGVVDKIQIFNTLGIDLTPTLSINGDGVRIDVSKLPAGVYFVKIGDKVEKFLKM